MTTGDKTCYSDSDFSLRWLIQQNAHSHIAKEEDSSSLLKFLYHCTEAVKAGDWCPWLYHAKHRSFLHLTSFPSEGLEVYMYMYKYVACKHIISVDKGCLVNYSLQCKLYYAQV